MLNSVCSNLSTVENMSLCFQLELWYLLFYTFGSRNECSTEMLYNVWFHPTVSPHYLVKLKKHEAADHFLQCILLHQSFVIFTEFVQYIICRNFFCNFFNKKIFYDDTVFVKILSAKLNKKLLYEVRMKYDVTHMT